MVQMARNKETGEVVAIKRIKKKYNSWDECMNLREIRSLKKLKHPNVIRLREVFKLEQELFLVFEYARTNLFKFYTEEYKDCGQPMPEHVIKSLIFQAVSALVYIHKMGFFHRDMKPENLLINERQVLKIADFGLAREIRSSPPYTEYVSTRWYRSPEILLKSTNYNSPVDIWALGCIMAELYLNGPLFQGASEIDQMAKIAAVLGHPGKTWPEGLKLASQTGFLFPNNGPQNLEDILKTASPLAIDMIKSMLNYDSSKRPTAAKLLQHPYFAQQQGMSFTDLPPTIPFAGHVPPTSQNKLTEPDSKQQNAHSTSNPLTQLNPHNLANIPLHNGQQHSQSVNPQSLRSNIKKNSLASRNLLSEMENNWREESFASNKVLKRQLQSPLPHHPTASKEESKITKFGIETDYEDCQFQKKLDSVFPGSLKSNSVTNGLLLPAQLPSYQNTKRVLETEEQSHIGNITAKKKQIDVELEELEKQILATKKKYSSPSKNQQLRERPAQSFEESAVSRKRSVFHNQNNPDNFKRGETGINSIFNDQLEELLNREQKILEQNSVKPMEGKKLEPMNNRISLGRQKNSTYDTHDCNPYINNPTLSDASKLKATNTQRILKEADSLENIDSLMASRPVATGFQNARVNTDKSKICALFGSKV